MIVEGLLTSTSAAGEINVAPMGPVIRGDFESMTLRPFAGSTTFENLSATRAGVFHVVDHVGLIAEAAVRRLTEIPPTFPAHVVSGVVLSECCRWFEFEIKSIDTTEARSIMEAQIVHRQDHRPFTGFNRAKHAVIEAAILATRLHILPRDEIEAQLRYLKPAVTKTGGTDEIRAFDMLLDFIQTAGAEKQ